MERKCEKNDYLTKQFCLITLLKNNLWAPLTTEVGLSPRHTDANRAARLRIHGHSRAESQVLALHVAGAGFLDARVVVSAGVHLRRRTERERLGAGAARAGPPPQSPATLLWHSLKVLSRMISHLRTAQALQ